MARTNRRNYYRILHVQPDAHEAVIKASYRTMMQKLRQHPDLGGDHWNASVLNEAYAVLSNPQKRAAYDARLLSQRGMDSVGQQHAGCRDSAAEEAPRRDTPKPSHASAGPQRTCGFCGAPVIRSRYTTDNSMCTSCHSPLLPVQKDSVSSADRRVIQRMGMTGNIRFFTTWPATQAYPASIRDLSPYGMQLVTSIPVAPGSMIKIEGEPLNAIAIVRSSMVSSGQAGGFLLGVEFKTLKFQLRHGTFVSSTA